MNSALIAWLMTASLAEVADNPHLIAASQIAESSKTGSLIFSEGDCLAVRAYTNSPYTHVATIVYDEQHAPIVYDSMNGTGVRKLPLAEYLVTQAPDEVRIFHPKREFTPDEIQRYQSHLESQIGRPYGVKHHITGKRAKGIHCSEYVTDALVEIDWLDADNPPRVSPASLVDGITAHAVYVPGDQIKISTPIEPVPLSDSRCARMWLETKSCVASCCSQMSRWVLCR